MQSEDVSETYMEGTSTSGEAYTEQTVGFVDNALGQVVEAATTYNPIAKVDNTEDVRLGQFLSRPTTIYTGTLTSSDASGNLFVIKPWQLFLNNVNIKKKIDNFAFFRGKLHIKVMINATPFHYGAYMLSYYPLIGNITNKNRCTSNQQNVANSQLPHIMIYPQANAGGEMELPFIYHKNWLDITSNTEVSNFGELQMNSFYAVTNCLDASATSISIRILAWATEVELMGPTAQLALQSDEYGNGPISKPASAIAHFANYLVDVPIIGRFARATQIGASAVSKVASLFGYTNVPNIDNPAPIVQFTAPHLATSQISVPYQKLTYDPKQELSIDPSLHGLKSHDELSLPYLKKKESFFGETIWFSTAAPGALLFSARISPNLKYCSDIVNGSASVVGRRVAHTPLSYISNIFKNWRGDIRIRIKIVCSKFHKGRIKIVYDPRSSTSTSDVDTNIVYTEIVDIGERDDITINVPYHQDLGWLSLTNDTNNDWITYDSLANSLGFTNGTLKIYVMNALEVPAGIAAPAGILAYISGGDTLEFANPQSAIGTNNPNVLPSLLSLQSEDLTNLSTMEINMGTPTKTDENRYSLNYGESVNSLRTVLQRMSVYDNVALPALTAAAINVYRKAYLRMPVCPGYVGNSFPLSAARVVGAGNTNFAPYTMHPLLWISSMYLGYRGSVNFAINANGQVNLDDIRVVRCTDTAAFNATARYVQSVASNLNSTSASTRAYFINKNYFARDGLGGAAIATNRHGSALLFNYPDMNQYNFSLADPNNTVAGSSVDGTDQQRVIMSVCVPAATAVSDAVTTICSYAGAGPDFTCLFFLHAPTVDYMTAAITPA